MTNIAQVRRALDGFHTYLEKNLPACEEHDAARVSGFWAQHFADRSNFPDASDFLAFRRGNFLYGIGDTSPSSPEQKHREFEETRRSISLFTPQAFLERLHEPALGAPLVYACGESLLSASYLLNAGTAWRIGELAARHGPPERPLRICEIGAGWGGCASQLHQTLDVASYTIIDLPENLCLSSTYLALSLKGRSAAFVGCAAGQPHAPANQSLNFGLPPAIDNLAGPFDLIINTMSFQEMDRETVNEYFAWSARVLAPDGLLVSFNSHDKAGVRRPSDYLRSDLRLLHMAPFRKVPAGYYNTIPYEMVFRSEHDVVHRPSAIDALGEMMQLGLDADLSELAADALSPAASAGSPAFLNRVATFFYATNEAAREAALADLPQGSTSITKYLAGSYWFAQGRMDAARANLQKSLDAGLADFAGIRARVLLATMAAECTTDDARSKLEQAAGGLGAEIAKIIDAQDVAPLQDHIARILDCPIGIAPASRTLAKRAWRRLTGTDGRAAHR